MKNLFIILITFLTCTFAQASWLQLDIRITGTGTITILDVVTSKTTTCSSSCVVSVGAMNTITLTAVPTNTFSGWSIQGGAGNICHGSGPCSMTALSNSIIKAVFK